MKALVVYTHPNDKSFNRAILSTVINGLEEVGINFRVRNLYAKRFSPVLEIADFEAFMAGRTPNDIQHEQQDVEWADTLVFIYPIWWWGPPAILKGWIDRVFSLGFAYNNTPQGPKPLLTGKRAVVITTSGSSEQIWNEHGFSTAVDKLLIQGIFNFVGINDIIFKNLYGIPMTSKDQRTNLLHEVKDIIKKL